MLRDLAQPIALLACFLAVGCGQSGSPLAESVHAERIVIEKSARRLTLYADGTVLKSYTVALGRQPVGAKEREGDDRTPEGVYLIDFHKTDSRYHRALHVSYPNDEDRKRSSAAGVPPGGDIMIHGIRNGFGWLGKLHRWVDWTRGCIAVTNGEIDEIFRAVPDGASVEIRP